MKLTGAQILLECLRAEGVETVFGYPGGVVLPLYDTFVQYPDIRHVLVRHEQAAAHAADGYARVSGRTGVCLATSGPGATNLVTGICTAYMDSVPMVVRTGNVARDLLGEAHGEGGVGPERGVGSVILDAAQREHHEGTLD